MAIQTFEQILKDIRNRNFRPTYFLMGEEPFFIDVLSESIEKNALNQDEREFNLSILYGKETDIVSILNAAKRFPMMAQYHLVVVREAQSLRNLGQKDKSKGDTSGESTGDQGTTLAKSSKKSKPKTPDEFDLLLKYLNNPLQTTILIFCHKYKSLSLKSKLVQAIEKNGVVFESKRINDNKLPAWIDDYIAKKGYRITPKASQMIADHLGNDLAKVINELQKLFIVLPKEKEITPAIVEENIGISKDFNIFELQTALGSLDREKAYRIVGYFGKNPKSNPFVLTLSMLYIFFQKIMMYHFAPDRSNTGLAGALGINPYFLRDYQNAAKNYPPARLENIFSLLRQYDLKSKGVGQRDTLQSELLKELIFKIMH